MKKNFKFMLVALLAFVGFNSAKAALPVQIEDAVYEYTLIGASDDVKLTADVFISGIIDDDGVVKSDKSIYLPGTFTYTQGSKVYTITVKYANAAVIQNHPEATSVVIPKQFVEIKASTFDGCSSLKTITFRLVLRLLLSVPTLSQRLRLPSLTSHPVLNWQNCLMRYSLRLD